MIYPKTTARIPQYIQFLEQRRFSSIAEPDFEYARTKKEYRSVPGDLEWTAMQLPFEYGEDWYTYWFRTRVSVPEAGKGKCLYFRARPEADSLVFINGRPEAGLNPQHHEFLLEKEGKPGNTYEIHMESYSGHTFPDVHPLQEDKVFIAIPSFTQYPVVFKEASLAVRNENIFQLYYHARALYETALQLEEDSLRKNTILHRLYQALMHLHFEDDMPVLEQKAGELNQRLTPLLEAKNGDTVPTVYLTGHAHLDHAWLWPIRETIRKAARTFTNMVRYMEQYDEFTFIQSMPAQLELVKKEYPAVFDRIKEAFEKGRWELEGGMYVESDCNLTSGESLIRQFLTGKKTSRELLGYEGKVLWLPDVFGYPGNLPQIMAGCEMEYFVTSKISWNDTTRFPYDLFIWEGIDGSRIKTGFITINYNGHVMPEKLHDIYKQVHHKEIQDSILYPIGEGDGGGGVRLDDLEMAGRLKNLEGCPGTQWIRVSEALDHMFEKDAELPHYSGELYLELHRGTYTSQAKTKQLNRQLEFKLRDAEFLHTLAWLKDPDHPYPAGELEACWKKLLANQFHDILPGSSIQQVYVDALADYDWIREKLEPLIRNAVDRFKTESAAGPGEAFGFINTLPWKRTGLVNLNEAMKDNRDYPLENANRKRLEHESGTSPLQQVPDFDGNPQPYALLTLPGNASTSCRLEETRQAVESPFTREGDRLQTPFYEVRFNAAGGIQHLQTPDKKEWVLEGRALNAFLLAEDVPLAWDAWDIDRDYPLKEKDEIRLQTTKVVSEGPLFLQIRNTYTLGKASEMIQDVVFYAHDRRIDFRTRVDWQEDHCLLKVRFPLNVHTHRARYEIQYGHLERDTHENQPFNRAQFETSGHKWASMEDAGHGMALLNDSKYGYSNQDSTLVLTLLKSAKAPDPTADMGRHHFTYSLLPFEAPFSVPRVVRPAYELNVPVLPVDGKPAPLPRLIDTDNEHIIHEVTKQAEDGTGIIVRLYEASGAERKASLRLSNAVKKAFLVNMLERKPQELKVDNNHLEIHFRPFEIITLKLQV